MISAVSTPEQDRIDEEASNWVVIQSDREMTADEQRTFDLWLAADRRHAETYHALQRTWSDIRDLKGLDELAPLGQDAAGAPSITGRPKRGLRAALAAAALAAAAAAAWFLVPGGQPLAPPAYSTDFAEMRQITLPDGSLVTLGPESELSERFSDTERRVLLTGGEAFFDVVRDGRTFIVQAGPSVIQVIGTKFDVRHGDGSVRVAVLEGAVRVAVDGPRSDGAGDAHVLRPGQQVEVMATTSGSEAPVATIGVPVSAPTPGAWREGRLVYQNVRLADLASEVNRYYGPGIELVGSEVGELRVTASFKTNEIPAFMSAVESVIPVEVTEDRDGSIRLSAVRP